MTPVPATRRSADRSRHRAGGRRRARSLLALAVLPIIAALSPSSAAWAATGDGNQIAPDSTTGYVSAASMMAKFIDSDYQLISRWSNATVQFHQMASGQLFGVSVAGVVQWFESAGMAFNNVMWQIAQWLVTLSGSFQLLTGSFGHSIDKTIATVGGVVMNGIPGNGLQGPVIFVLLLFAAIGIALAASLRSRSGTMMIRRLVGITVIFALFSFMVTQAGRGTDGNDGEYHPAPMSPVWVGTTTSGIVDKVSGGLSNAIASASFGGSDLTSTNTDKSNLSCGSEVKGLATQLGATPAALLGDKAQESALSAVNALYGNTALVAYANAQYGGTVYGLRVWCRGADYNSNVGVTSIQQTAYSGAAGAPLIDKAAPASTGGPGWLGTPATDGSKYSSAAAFGNGSGEQSVWDQEIIAWAACHPAVTGSTSSTSAGDVTFSIDSGWSGITDAAITQDDCTQWWKGDGGKIPGNFSTISGWSESDVTKNIPDPNVARFVNTLHGNDQGALWGGLVVVSAASFGSLTNAVIIGGLALGNIVAKILLMFLLLVLPFILLRGLFSSGPMFGHVGNHLKAILGVLIFTVALGLILALITLMSSLLSAVGVAITGTGNIMSMIWTAACPVLAVFGLHFIFKKLGLPSPVTITGAAAWGNMLTKGGAAAAGGAVAAGIGARAQAMASRAMGGAGNQVTDGIRGGAGGRGVRGGRGMLAEAALSAGVAESVSRRNARSAAQSAAQQEQAKKVAAAQFESEKDGAASSRRRWADSKLGQHAAKGASALGAKVAGTRVGQNVVGAYGHGRTAAKWVATETRAGRATVATARGAAQATKMAATSRAGKIAGRAALVGGATVLAGPIGLAAATVGVTAGNRMSMHQTQRKALVDAEVEKLRQGSEPKGKTDVQAPAAATPDAPQQPSLVLPGTPEWRQKSRA